MYENSTSPTRQTPFFLQSISSCPSALDTIPCVKKRAQFRDPGGLAQTLCDLEQITSALLTSASLSLRRNRQARSGFTKLNDWVEAVYIYICIYIYTCISIVL